ncbi:thiamine diphosphokinase [Anoxybacillus sp. J5B_2022]|uniref:thiamine diphosphokinase n=1 Tax=Anoxybacillus sp. J5B_2022 TaxID=3003246 RepID=UPI002285D4AF|nr:thiamine diphosphokinase [Anoxybacillus sp. J5B_2022]MCZ0756080.1 thiamine diphosphokinase [Anoxybacillus sp. J5B_2022]
MILHIVGGGPDEFIPSLHHYHGDNVQWIGVDRGVMALLRTGIRPIKAFGDFDSISGQELEYVQSVLDDLDVWPSEKDKTDMEIALEWAVEQEEADLIRLFGATGGRIDHLFGNVQLLAKYMNKRIEIIDKQNVVTVHSPSTYSVLRDEHRYISFIPLSYEVKGITLKGFKYPLTNCHIQLGSTLCISNELIQSSGTFSFSEGILMMVRSKDLGGDF